MYIYYIRQSLIEDAVPNRRKGQFNFFVIFVPVAMGNGHGGRCALCSYSKPSPFRWFMVNYM